MSVIAEAEVTPTKTPADSRYSVGTLRYTRGTLFQVFAWLLWGDFCFMLMETVVPAIMPLKLRHLDSPNWVIALIMSTLPGMLNMTVCPWVSFKSDRYRSRMGRRIPFILWTLPFLSAFLILLGFSSQIGSMIHSLLPLRYTPSPSVVTITCIGVFVVGFQFFNMFVNSVFWYLFNDVVPAAFMGRFLGLFRIVVGIQTALFNFFVFRYAESHMTEIFLGASIVYAVGFGLMCLMVKEGQYPPPEQTIDGKSGLISEFKTYATECYSQRYYWNLFLYTTCVAVSTTIGVFGIFFNQSIGLDLEKIGIIAGIAGVVNVILTYPAGVLADRYHPLRLLFWSQRINLCLLPLGLLWLFVDFKPQIVFYIAMVISLLTLPIAVTNDAVSIPLYMRILPHDRYGQFSSAQALIRSLGTIIGGLLAGVFMDIMRSAHPQSDFGYRYYPLWVIFWTLLGYMFLGRLYRDWMSRQHAAVNTSVI